MDWISCTYCGEQGCSSTSGESNIPSLSLVRGRCCSFFIHLLFCSTREPPSSPHSFFILFRGHCIVSPTPSPRQKRKGSRPRLLVSDTSRLDLALADPINGDQDHPILPVRASLEPRVTKANELIRTHHPALGCCEGVWFRRKFRPSPLGSFTFQTLMQRGARSISSLVRSTLVRRTKPQSALSRTTPFLRT